MNPKPYTPCEACNDDVELKGGGICQECCPHNEHDHFICLDCGHEGEPSDYYDEDYGKER
jgi:Fe2+ or Zn2+ uptake regulation protein